MGFVFFLVCLAVLVSASALGWVADSRKPGPWYPAGPDTDEPG